MAICRDQPSRKIKRERLNEDTQSVRVTLIEVEKIVTQLCVRDRGRERRCFIGKYNQHQKKFGASERASERER